MLPTITQFVTMVGSRKIPMECYVLMRDIAYKFTIFKQRFETHTVVFEVRTGDAKGSDAASAEGVRAAGGRPAIYVARDCTPEAMAISQYYHPAWDRLSQYAKMLHGRNAFQVLGRGLDVPSIGLICWTPDGCQSHAERSIRTGGTGTAISIASSYGVPVSNIRRREEWNKWMRWVNNVQRM